MAYKERPILFGGEMVTAILSGMKSQTRRVIKPQPEDDLSWVTEWGQSFFTPDSCISGRGRRPRTGQGEVFLRCPYQIGMKLLVRETWAVLALDSPARSCMAAYRADGELSPDTKVYRMAVPESAWPKAVGLLARRWRPSIFMPRWASRLTLEIASVKVERVQAITDDDAIEEGVDRTNTSIPTYARQRYQKLWDSINAKRVGCSWADNPWVFAIAFRRT